MDGWMIYVTLTEKLDLCQSQRHDQMSGWFGKQLSVSGLQVKTLNSCMNVLH